MRCTPSKPFRSLIAAVFIVASLALPHSPAYAQVPDAAAPGSEEFYVPGRLVVGVDPNMAPMQASDALAALDAQVVQAADPCVGGLTAAGDVGGEVAVQSWQVPPGREDEAIALLREQPGVRYVTRDVYMYAAQDGTADEIVEPAAALEASAAAERAFSINDPLYASHQWGPQRANFPRAWQLLPTGDALTPIRVAVIDSGVDFDHPDLAGRLLPGQNYIVPSQPPYDENGHGTHVSGIIAAITNNGIGIAGSAPKVLIDPYKVLDANGSGNATNLRYAVCDAARAGARVVNMSVQIPPSLMPPGSSLYNMLKQAMVFAASRGVLLIAAGGNSYTMPQVYYPALFDEVVAVASLTIDNQRPGYGPIGSKVEVAAPGGDDRYAVLSTWPAAPSVRELCGTRLVQSGSAWYCGEYGTSMASPYVVGEAALLMSIQPSLTAAETRAILRETAVNLGLPAEIQGAGLINAAAAVRRLGRSSLYVEFAGASRSVPYGSAPYTVTMVVSNPSLSPVSVTGVVTGSSWLSVPGLGESSFSAALAYGGRIAMPVVISPTNLVTGTYVGQIQLAATRTDGSQIKSTPAVYLSVGKAAPPPLYLPLALSEAVPPAATPLVSFSWETPISPTVYAMTGTESVDVTLPFAFPLAGPAGSPVTEYSQARIYADGFVIFPDADTVTLLTTTQNRCLPWSPGGLQGVFGWWSNLNALSSEAEIATFRPAADRFVIQYKNLSSVGILPAYQVTFQIVLFRSGDVQLNYLQAPSPWSPSFDQLLPAATVGVQARNGLYRNQVACVTDSTLLGVLPQSGQSLRIKSGEVY